MFRITFVNHGIFLNQLWSDLFQEAILFRNHVRMGKEGKSFLRFIYNVHFTLQQMFIRKFLWEFIG